MIQLTGNNLRKRQQELNNKVNEAFANETNFEDIKNEPGVTDVDKIFKIDLAAKYKNVDYIVEVLKSGDSLYVSRVLKKCPWLYDENYSIVINTDYLHHNVFPFMSIKMKKKLLTAVSIAIESEKRAAEFYNYCLRIKFNNLADKFLLRTSESFKLNCLENGIINSDIKYLKLFIGNSFALLEAYIDKLSEWQSINLIEFRHLYAISDELYLNLLEKHVKINKFRKNELGLRISKHIMTKHKNRVLKNPKLYVTILNKIKLVRHSNVNDAKMYVISLMPKETSEFWDMNFYKTYKYIIEIIPEHERYTFLQKTFTGRYPSDEFEMNKSFFDQNYYNLMSLTEQEDWALRHIASRKELLGAGRDYIWYKFVNFEKAFVEIKKYIKMTTDHNKRTDIIKVLVESAKNQYDLEQLLKYYYERHVNESKNSKEAFLNKVLRCHKVFKFNNDCWEAFDKILHSLNVYNVLGHEASANLKVVSLLYHILHNKSMPHSLQKYLNSEMSSYNFKCYVDDFTNEEKQTLYKYIFNFYINKIESFSTLPKDSKELEETKSKVTLYIHFLLEFMAMYKKQKNDIPEIVMKFIKLDWNSFRYQQILEEKSEEKISERKLLKCMKENAYRLVDTLGDLKSVISDNWSFRMNTFLKKLRIYFVSDISKEYLKFFQQLLLEKVLQHRVAATAVFSIFQLSDEASKIDFMKNYAPKSAKIDHVNVDPVHLNIQENICRFACYSRPPVPLSSVIMYLKGDYVRYCLPMFNMYLANLPQPLCLKFVESIIQFPISVQKHGLRLAFKCFDADNLTKLVLDCWRKTKNVSLRSVIYRAFFKKNMEEDSRELFDVLKTLTADIKEDDDDELFNIIMRNKLSEEFLGEFYEIVWNTVQKFSNNQTNLLRKLNMIHCVDDSLRLMKKDILKSIIDEHLETVFNESMVEINDSNANLIGVKWELTAHYIVYFTNSEEDRKESIEVAKTIIQRCIENWNKVVGDVYLYRRICYDLIKKLDRKSLSDDAINYESSTCVFEAILEKLQSSLPIYEIYIFVWKLRLKMITGKLIEAHRKKCTDENKVEMTVETAVIYGKEIGKLIAEFVEKNLYYSYFTNHIVEMVIDYIYDIISSNITTVKYHDILVAFTRGLLECNTSEARSFALQVLPQDPEEECNLNAFKEVFESLRGQADMELNSCLYEKYYSDCKRRRFL
ncbi:unnamed protein product [Diatraea saccharalis]|uniref:Uncharacterized protein n=1 Tax=Diatraea saccharalis TaxID=40085 RepID=A0A9N9R8K0_9NEOP|nr:unnamed protein product [Diatraea saccharalis]